MNGGGLELRYRLPINCLSYVWLALIVLIPSLHPMSTITFKREENTGPFLAYRPTTCDYLDGLSKTRMHKLHIGALLVKEHIQIMMEMHALMNASQFSLNT